MSVSVYSSYNIHNYGQCSRMLEGSGKAMTYLETVLSNKIIDNQVMGGWDTEKIV